MTMWTIAQDRHAGGAISICEQGGVPILTAHVGTYPTAVADDGRSTRQVPHILISVQGGRINGVPFFNGVTVQAFSLVEPSGRQRHLTVFSDVNHGGRRDESMDAWISLGESKITDALSVVATIDAQYDAAALALEPAQAYRHPLSRADYETACNVCGAEALTDDACQSYGVQYGVFTYPEYAVEHIVKMHLAAMRWRHIEADQKTARQSASATQQSVPVRTGQLWEPCEQCGCEPVYMPLHLCDKCWPKCPI
jgi:hypothetical protein